VSLTADEHAGNIRRFIAFRILFNARWYYPIYALLFLDLGLGLGAFSLLNGLWALTIVLCEVPSGALADRFGRRTLLIAAAGFMVAEMFLLTFAPADGGLWLLLALGANRILSGMAEASASGADEALAYDSLPETGRDEAWSRILTKLMRWQSLSMMGAMLLGAALYDPAFIQSVLRFFTIDWEISAEVTHRLPPLLTLLNAVVLVFVTIGFKEAPHATSGRASWIGAFQSIPRIAAWILGRRAVLLVILAGMMLDSFVRLFLTLNSGYYRLIGLPEASYGLIASTMGLFGVLIPPLAARIRHQLSRTRAFLLASVTLLTGLGIIGFVRHPAGVLGALLLGAGMFFIGFLVSAYLNADTSSDKRATVLSFKGLAFNIGYGGASAWFAILQSRVREPDMAEETALGLCLPWIPLAAATGIVAVLLVGALTRRKTS